MEVGTLKYSTALAVANRHDVKISTLIRFAQEVLPTFQGRQKVRLAIAIFENQYINNRSSAQLETIIIRELFEENGAESLTVDELLFILPNIIHSGHEEIFVKYIKEHKQDFSSYDYEYICERYTLLEADSAYVNDTIPKHISEKWANYVFFE